MDSNRMQARKRIRELAQRMLPKNDFAGLFNAVYETADGNTDAIPWADLEPHPLSLLWLQQQNIQGQGKHALVVGCGLGDDAEDLAGRGFQVTAFDISPRAISWCQERFPNSPVTYVAADLFEAPSEWQQGFDFALEIYTVQSLPVQMRTRAIESIAGFIAPGGRLLTIYRGRDLEEDPGSMPWPLTRDEMTLFQKAGLKELTFEDLHAWDQRHFRAVYER